MANATLQPDAAAVHGLAGEYEAPLFGAYSKKVGSARHASVVFTREFSDWSTMNDLATSGPVWWKVVRKPDSLETLCSVDGKNFTSVTNGVSGPFSFG